MSHLVLLLDTSSYNSILETIPSIAYLSEKLVNTGLFSPIHQPSLLQPSFFASTLPTIRARLSSADSPAYSKFWSDILSSIQSSLVIQSIITSLFVCLPAITSVLSTTHRTRALIKKEAILLKHLIGSYSKNDGEHSDIFSAAIVGRHWDEGHARIYACWIAGAEKDNCDEESMSFLNYAIYSILTELCRFALMFEQCGRHVDEY